MIAAGRYKARADGTTIKWGLSKAGNEQIAVEFLLTDLNQRRTWTGNFGDKGMKFALDALKAMGWDGSDLERLGPSSSQGIGSVDCDVTIEQETYNDDNGVERVTDKILWVNPSGFSFKQELPADRKSALAARVKAAMAGRQDAPRNYARPAGQTYQQKADAKEWDGTGQDPNEDPLPF